MQFLGTFCWLVFFLSFEAWVHHPVSQARLATYPRFCLCGVIIMPWQPVGQDWWEVTVVIIANVHSSLIEALSSTDWNSSYDSLLVVCFTLRILVSVATSIRCYTMYLQGQHNNDSYATTGIITNRHYHIDLLHTITSTLKLKCCSTSVEYHSAPTYNYIHIIAHWKPERNSAYKALYESLLVLIVLQVYDPISLLHGPVAAVIDLSEKWTSKGTNREIY